MISANVIMTGSYDYRLVVLSVLIAMFASYAALDLSGRITAASGWGRAAWLTGGSTAMGFGIWSMHFTGMLAFGLPVPVRYDWPTVLVSLLAAIFSSAVTLSVVSRKKMGPLHAWTGSLVTGVGISAMHYTGMAAMRLAAVCRFDLHLVTLSVVLSILISLAALSLAFYFRKGTSGAGWQKIAGAMLLGAAIPVTHYSGMAAARFMPSNVPQDLSHSVSISSLGTAGIATATLIVLSLTVLMSFVDRRFYAQALELELSEQRYRQLFERSLAAVYRTVLGGHILDCNAMLIPGFLVTTLGKSNCLIGSMILIRRFCFGGKQLQLGALAVLIEDLHGLLPTRVSGIVQLPEITNRALPRTIGGTHRLDQRPVAILLVVLVDVQLSQKHAGNLSLLYNSNKGVGFHYNHFPSGPC